MTATLALGVIPSERSESKDLHASTSFRERPTDTWYWVRQSYPVLPWQSYKTLLAPTNLTTSPAT